MITPVKVNPNDEKLILHLPDDPEPRVELKAKETKNKRQIFKMSKEVLRNVGIGQKNEDGKNRSFSSELEVDFMPSRIFRKITLLMKIM